jgi:hypothetical protein
VCVDRGMGYISHTTEMAIMVALDTCCATCERSMVTLQNFPRRHFLASSLHSQPLLKASVRNSGAHPSCLIVSRRRAASMGAFLSLPHIDGSYLDVGRFSTPMTRISMPAINIMAPSTALPALYKHAILAGHGTQTLDLNSQTASSDKFK